MTDRRSFIRNATASIAATMGAGALAGATTPVEAEPAPPRAPAVQLVAQVTAIQYRQQVLPDRKRRPKKAIVTATHRGGLVDLSRIGQGGGPDGEFARLFAEHNMIDEWVSPTIIRLRPNYRK